jgi:hypothetical protein
MLQVVTTILYYTIARLHNLQSLRTNLLTLSAVVFTYSVSLNQSLQIEPSIHTLHLHKQTFRILLVYDWFGYHCIHLENWTVSADSLQDNFSARTPRKTVSLLL